MTSYEGPERRKDYVELDQALEQVGHLHGAVTTLANAMSNAVPKQELEDLKVEVRRDYMNKLYAMVILSACIVTILIIVINLKINNLNDDVKKGHDVITCLQTKTEAQRTGDAGPTALLLCTQTQKG